MGLSPEYRPFYDDLIVQVPVADGVQFEYRNYNGVSGWLFKPASAPSDSVILYSHGGGYILGSADAYRNVASHFSAATGMMAFVVDYALAPEKPFPAAFDDVLLVYKTLLSEGFTKIALVGDSAGGGLTLALSGTLSTMDIVKPVAAVAISPWVDMTASGLSYQTRSESDPFLNKQKLLDATSLYLRDKDPRDPRASALFGNFINLPPTLIHVGHDEVLLYDAIRYTEMGEKSGANVELHIWTGMLHVFTSNFVSLEAARTATANICSFLKSHISRGE